jgi:phage terminase small subunit
MNKKEEKPLNERQEVFCKEYIYDWNATRAYQIAFPDSGYNAARSSASTLLTNSNIQAYIKELQADLEKVAGLSRLKVVTEFKKIAFTSIAHLHNTWVERRKFEELSEDQKSCISEIETRIVKKNIGTSDDPEIVDIEQIKVKLHDKQRALDAINKMLGYNEPDKMQIDGPVQITGMKII